MEYIKKVDLLAAAVEVEYLGRPRMMVSVATIGKMPSIEAVPLEYHNKVCEEMARRHQAEILELTADRPQGDSVSRRYLLAEIDDLADEFSEVDENGLHSERWCGILDSKGVIVNAPSVSDRPQGEWKSVKASIYPYGYDVECSVCGHRMGSSFGYKYCPMCGAHMKGAGDE